MYPNAHGYAWHGRFCSTTMSCSVHRSFCRLWEGNILILSTPASRQFCSNIFCRQGSPPAAHNILICGAIVSKRNRKELEIGQLSSSSIVKAPMARNNHKSVATRLPIAFLILGYSSLSPNILTDGDYEAADASGTCSIPANKFRIWWKDITNLFSPFLFAFLLRCGRRRSRLR